MMIDFIETGKVLCQPNDAMSLICKPIEMFTSKAECGSCPIIAMFEAFEKELWGDYDEGRVSIPKLKERLENKGKEADKPRDDEEK